MKNADDAIERVLTGLRDAEAPAGMERRILAAMEDRAFSPGRAGAGAGWRLPLWLVAAARPWVVRYVVMGFAAACVIALVVAIPGSRRQQGSLKAQAPFKATMGSVVSGPMAPAVDETVMASGRPSAARVLRTARVANEPEGPAIGWQEGGGNEDRDMDAVAMSEMKAASFPAPPMPLTEQERLLLRMVHRGEPVELAMLDPRLEAISDAEEKEEFQRFFAKPAVKDAAADGLEAGQTGAGQSSAESAAESVAAPAAEGVSPAAGATEQTAPEKTGPAVANPEQPNGKDGLPQQITTVERD
jgi:hypothetical protein